MSKWTKLLHNNTRYFHQRTLVRRYRNKIISFWYNVAKWIYDDDVLIQQAVDFIHQIYSVCSHINSNFINISTFPHINDNDMENLVSTIA